MDTSGKKRLFEYIVSKINLTPDMSVLDFGCGTGDLLGILAEKSGFDFQFLGIDSAESLIKRAREKYPDITFLCEKFQGTFNLSAAVYDLIVTIDVVECISDKDALIGEFHRILKPGGKVLAAHWDWDTMLYNAPSREIARRAVAAFSDWKQPWMDNCDGQMGRKLWGLFEGSGKFRGMPGSFDLIETSYQPGTYGFGRMQDIALLIDTGSIGKEEYEKLHGELIEQNERGHYFFGLTSFLYCGKKI